MGVEQNTRQENAMTPTEKIEAAPTEEEYRDACARLEWRETHGEGILGDASKADRELCARYVAEKNRNFS